MLQISEFRHTERASFAAAAERTREGGGRLETTHSPLGQRGRLSWRLAEVTFRLCDLQALQRAKAQRAITQACKLLFGKHPRHQRLPRDT